VGVHLALNSEWKGYRWGPILGKEAVPTLVDSVGYFTSSTEQFLARKYDLGEVERELTAQVERARRSGLKIDTMFDTPIAEKQPAFATYLNSLASDRLNLVVVHVGRATPELAALVDMNDPTQNTTAGEPLMARHRQAELEMLLSPEFARLRTARSITLLTYADLMQRVGRAGMRRPGS